MFLKGLANGMLEFQHLFKKKLLQPLKSLESENLKIVLQNSCNTICKYKLQKKEKKINVEKQKESSRIPLHLYLSTKHTTPG